MNGWRDRPGAAHRFTQVKSWLQRMPESGTGAIGKLRPSDRRHRQRIDRGEVWLGRCERPLDGAKHKVVNLTTVTEAHFELRRMGVHIDEHWIDADAEHVRGMAA